MFHIYADPLSYFSFHPVLHDWCNKGRGMGYPVCGMVHIKEPLLLIDKSSLCGGSVVPFSLSEWSLTICLTPYNRRYNVLSASLNKTFLSISLVSHLPTESQHGTNHSCVFLIKRVITHSPPGAVVLDLDSSLSGNS